MPLSKKRNSERMKLVYWKKRLAVIDKLGGVCRRCGINDPRILQVNHINGGGTQELRREANRNWYGAIISGRRPCDDLELLCANCNIIYEYETGRRQWDESHIVQPKVLDIVQPDRVKIGELRDMMKDISLSQTVSLGVPIGDIDYDIETDWDSLDIDADGNLIPDF